MHVVVVGHVEPVDQVLTAFFVVWMVSHVINVLIMVSPLGTVDALLKFARFCMLSFVALSALITGLYVWFQLLRPRLAARRADERAR